MIQARILARIAWLFVNILNWSVRVRFVNKESPDRLASTRENIIYAFSHGDMVPLLHIYRNSGFLIPVSESRDGEIMVRLLRNFGFDVVRGSSKRKGHKALLELISGMKRGRTVTISVDGLRGRLLISAPFAEVILLCGDPIYVSGTSDTKIHSGPGKLETYLQELKHKAQITVMEGPWRRSHLRSGYI